LNLHHCRYTTVFCFLTGTSTHFVKESNTGTVSVGSES
jgi:hypothetical protein